MPDELPPVAGLGRRAVALAIDWTLASVISAGFFDYHPMATLGTFAVMTIAMVATISASIGHLVVGIGVRTPGRGPAGPLRALLRTVLLCLVIPAVVWTADGRGLHDVAAGTTVTRIR
ncbi:RDD family protein [Georgenia deserti]|uniref:RDD family protein n=1 Tax=Georgenia deserti TaxID=2093781 RepID=A0ABW4L786_9MICO